MDIGDPSEIPARRKPLPSMQELGAFELDDSTGAAGSTGHAPAVAASRRPEVDRPVTRPAPWTDTAPPSLHTRPGSLSAAPIDGAQATPDAAGSARAAAAARPNLTPEQLRQALAKADPDTRQKLLSLIVGGRPIQRGGAGLEIKPGPSRVEPPTGPRAGASTRSAPATPRASGTAGASAGRYGPEPLLKIDERTELLDAAAAPASAEQRKSTMQAQLDAALQPKERPRTEAAAPKVIFPAYDPTRHGDDVRSTARRRSEGPVEGHFPAPRQPMRSAYQHPDGKPMSAEESKVEEVLQAQRCEETITVLAREGVNGLLLSPRDLDAAVASGLLDAATAATLWKTWSALRPVIHVIEDEPPAPTAEAADTSPAPLEPGEAGERPPVAGAEAGVLEEHPVAPPAVATAARTEAPALPAALAAAPEPEPEPASTPAAPIPAPSPSPSPGYAATAEPNQALQPPVSRLPSRARGWQPLRWALLAFVGYAAFSTAWELGRELWNTGWGWMLLDWLQGFRH